MSYFVILPPQVWGRQILTFQWDIITKHDASPSGKCCYSKTDNTYQPPLQYVVKFLRIFVVYRDNIHLTSPRFVLFRDISGRLSQNVIYVLRNQIRYRQPKVTTFGSYWLYRYWFRYWWCFAWAGMASLQLFIPPLPLKWYDWGDFSMVYSSLMF